MHKILKPMPPLEFNFFNASSRKAINDLGICCRIGAYLFWERAVWLVGYLLSYNSTSVIGEGKEGKGQRIHFFIRPRFLCNWVIEYNFRNASIWIRWARFHRNHTDCILRWWRQSLSNRTIFLFMAEDTITLRMSLHSYSVALQKGWPNHRYCSPSVRIFRRELYQVSGGLNTSKFGTFCANSVHLQNSDHARKAAQ